MPGPVTTVEIEDVLSSIRRLVAEGDTAPTTSEVKSEGNGKRPERLVLTPNFRVERDVMDEPAVKELFEEDQDHQPVLILRTADSVEETTQPDEEQHAGRESLEATIAELEAAVTAQPDEWEPDGSEVKGDPSWSDAGFEASAEHRDISDNADADDLVSLEKTVSEMRHRLHMVGGRDLSTDDIEDAETIDTPSSEAAQDRTNSRLDVSGPIFESIASISSQVVEAEVTQTLGLGRKAANTEPAVDARPTPQQPKSPASEAKPPQPADADQDYGDALIGGDLAPDEDLDAYLARGSMIDEDALRDIVLQTVREELHGKLGERITRNVRKLVRREIHRVLNSQDLD